MKILVLCGPSGSGKTSSLKMLIDELKKEGVEVESRSDIESKHGDGDVRVVLTWGGRRVGICTGGDSKPIIANNFKFLRDNECDIGISGLRHNNRSWAFLFELINCCRESEIPRFVWKLKNDEIKPKKWESNDVDRVVVGQLKLMLQGGL